MWAQFHSAWSHGYHPPIAASQRLVTWIPTTNRTFTTLGHMDTIHQSQLHNAWSHGYHPPIAASQRLVTWIPTTNRTFTTLGHMDTIHQSQLHNAWSHGYHPPIETHLSPTVTVSVGNYYFHSNCNTRFKHCGACGLFSNLFLLLATWTFALDKR